MLEEREAERAREENAAALRRQAARRARHWTAAEHAAEAPAAVAVDETSEQPSPQKPVLVDVPLQKAKQDVRTTLSDNPDVAHVLQALQHYYYGDGSEDIEGGELPEQLWVVHSGCVPAKLMHHPDNIDRVAYQSVFASPSFRGNPRYSRVAIGPPDGAEESVWRGEVRLLFKAYHPQNASMKEDLVLLRYFEDFLGNGSAFPPCVLTHTYHLQQPEETGAAGGAAEGGKASGSRRPRAQRFAAEPRADAQGRYTGAIRIRFAPRARPFTHRYAVVPLTSLIRVEHVLPDFARQGLDGVYDAYFVNPWKWALESVGDDAGKGELIEMAPL